MTSKNEDSAAASRIAVEGAIAPTPSTNMPSTDAAPSTNAAPSFFSLGVSPKLCAALGRGGIKEPFPVQVLTIPDVLAGRDVCGKARTGSGKTLAFGLPLIDRTARSAPRLPQSVVLVPTRELASQVVAALAPLAAYRNVRITAIYGGVSLNRQAQILRAGVDIVVATPGRLNDLLQRSDCRMDDVRMVVLDEADQMADLGFMPQVERILSRIPNEHQTLLFSATLDGAVDQLVKRHQTNPVFHEFVSTEEDEVTMTHRFIGVADDEKVAVAADIAAGPGRTLIFVSTQRGAERLSRQLDLKGVAAGVIHGGLSQPKRERALHAFASGSSSVLVATNVAARGIHVDGVDIVIHHDPPEDTKTYLHRSGRTARAGASGVVVTLVSPMQVRDVNIIRREAGLHEAVVTMSPGDPRLGDLEGWVPPNEEFGPVTQQHSGGGWRSAGGPGPRRDNRGPQGGGFGRPRPRSFGPPNGQRRDAGPREEFQDRGPRRERPAVAPGQGRPARPGDGRNHPEHSRRDQGNWGRRSE